MGVIETEWLYHTGEKGGLCSTSQKRKRTTNLLTKSTSELTSVPLLSSDWKFKI